MADIRQRIVATDETAAAYNSASRRVAAYRAQTKGGSKATADMSAKAANAAESVGALGSSLNGSTEAMSRVANAAGKLLPGIAGIAGPVAIAIAAIAALKMAWNEFGLTTRLKSWFSGKPMGEVMGFAEAVKRASDDFVASLARMRDATDASFDAAGARIERQNADSPMAKAAMKARLDYEKEVELIKRASQDAETAVRMAEDKLKVTNKAAGAVASEDELKAIREAEGELERARADAAAKHLASVDRQTAAYDRLQTQVQASAKAIEEAGQALRKAELEGQLEQASDEAKQMGGYVDRVAQGITALLTGDKRILGAAKEALGGGEQANDDLKRAQQNVADLKLQGQLFAARQDPEQRAAAKRADREIRRTESRLARAEAAEARGGRMATWQREMLRERDAIKFRNDQQAMKEAADRKAQALKEQIAAQQRAKMTASLTSIEADMKKTLAAAGA